MGLPNGLRYPRGATGIVRLKRVPAPRRVHALLARFFVAEEIDCIHYRKHK